MKNRKAKVMRTVLSLALAATFAIGGLGVTAFAEEASVDGEEFIITAFVGDEQQEVTMMSASEAAEEAAKEDEPIAEAGAVETTGAEAAEEPVESDPEETAKAKPAWLKPLLHGVVLMAFGGLIVVLADIKNGKFKKKKKASGK